MKIQESYGGRPETKNSQRSTENEWQPLRHSFLIVNTISLNANNEQHSKDISKLVPALCST